MIDEENFEIEADQRVFAVVGNSVTVGYVVRINFGGTTPHYTVHVSNGEDYDALDCTRDQLFVEFAAAKASVMKKAAEQKEIQDLLDNTSTEELTEMVRKNLRGE